MKSICREKYSTAIIRSEIKSGQNYEENDRFSMQKTVHFRKISAILTPESAAFDCIRQLSMTVYFDKKYRSLSSLTIHFDANDRSVRLDTVKFHPFEVFIL